MKYLLIKKKVADTLKVISINIMDVDCNYNFYKTQRWDEETTLKKLF